MRSRLFAPLLVIAGALLAAPAAPAATLSVDDDGQDCPAAPFSSIQAAVDAADPGDTVAICRRAVRKARLSKALRRKVRWVTTRRTVTLVVRRTRTEANTHDRGVWVGRIITPLKRGGVRILLGQL